MNPTVVPSEVAKRAIFVQEFRSVIESRNIFSPVATRLVSQAKNLYSPFTSVSVAKAHTQACRVPVGVQALGVDELVLDRKIGNAIIDCLEELSYAAFDIIGSYRADLYASVLRKLNIELASDFLADATVSAGTVALSTPAEVANFLISVAADAGQATVGVRQTIDGATVVRSRWHGRPFVAAGRTAYIAIVSQIASIVGQSSLLGLESGSMVETPYGVLVINLGDAVTNPKQLLYGTAGVPVMAFREDQIEVDMGEYVTPVLYAGASADLDVEPGDSMLEKSWYISAQTKGKGGIFSNVAGLVFSKLMT